MQIQGKITVIDQTQQISESFTKREFVVEYAENPQYPEFIKLEFIKDKCAVLDQYQVGQSVTVEFNLKGRKWTDPQGIDKYFNTLQAWKVSSQQQQQANHSQQQQQQENSHSQQNRDEPLEQDIPF